MKTKLNISTPPLRAGMAALGAIAALIGTATSAQAITFDFTFDNTNEGARGPVTPPIVGTGTFSFDDPGGTGTFDFFSLTNRSLSFSFGSGNTFDDSDITTTSGTLVEITGTPGSRSLVFTGGGNGSFGSLDLQDNANTTETELSFGPTSLEGLYRTNNDLGNLGNYEAVEASSTPVPFGVNESLGLVGLATLVGLRQARKYYSKNRSTSAE